MCIVGKELPLLCRLLLWYHMLDFDGVEKINRNQIGLLIMVNHSIS